jgi:hypothetical protein
MPYRHHDPQRHHIPKARYRVTNWPEYDRGLVRRGDIRLWIDEKALEHWFAPRRGTPGGQRVFSNLAIETMLTLGAAFKLRLRQTEGLVRSLLELMGSELPVPDHTTLARRRRTVSIDMAESPRRGPMDIVLDSTGLKFHGPGEWARAKHGEKRRSWRKLHVSVDPDRGEIIAHALTDDDTSDASQAGGLTARSGGRIRTVFADGAYDGAPVYAAIRAARPAKSPPGIVIPPQPQSIRAAGGPHGGTERERHAAEIARHGRMAWQERHRYGRRALRETGVGRLKANCEGRLHARAFGAQCKEAAIHVRVANRRVLTAKPVTVRVT